MYHMLPSQSRSQKDALCAGVVARRVSAVLGLDMGSILSSKLSLRAKGHSGQSSGWSKASTEVVRWHRPPACLYTPSLAIHEPVALTAYLRSCLGCVQGDSPSCSVQITEAFDHALPQLWQHIAVNLLVDSNVVSVFLCAEAVQEVSASISHLAISAPVLRLALRL